MHNMTARPNGGNRENGLASTLQIIAFIIWGGGLILGIVMGVKLGKMQYYADESEFSWQTALAIWTGAFLSGLFPFVFAEIICLLQKGNTLSYVIEKSGYDMTISETQDDKGSDKHGLVSYNLDNEEQMIPFDLRQIIFMTEEAGRARTVLQAKWMGGLAIQGILADVKLTTIYDETYKIKDISFVNLKRNDDFLTSDEVTLNISDNILNSTKYVRLAIKKYVVQDAVHVPGDEFSVSVTNPNGGGIGINAFLNEIDNMNRVSEIWAFVKKMSEAGDPIISKELMDIVNQEGYAEKTQGNTLVNHRDKCVQKIMKMFGYEYEMPQRNSQHSSQNPPLSLNRPSQSIQSVNRQPRQSTYEGDDFYGDDGQLFCIKCGSKIEDAEAMFCPVCGERIKR